jgi:hypothetical protein
MPLEIHYAKELALHAAVDNVLINCPANLNYEEAFEAIYNSEYENDEYLKELISTYPESRHDDYPFQIDPYYDPFTFDSIQSIAGTLHNEVREALVNYTAAIKVGMLFRILTMDIDMDATTWDLHAFANVGRVISCPYRHDNKTYKFNWEHMAWCNVNDTTDQLPYTQDTGHPVIRVGG